MCQILGNLAWTVHPTGNAFPVPLQSERMISGNIVTTPQTDMMYVVTEYGMVNLKGKSVAERATALVSIAHPDFREKLERDAYERGLIPKGYY